MDVTEKGQEAKTREQLIQQMYDFFTQDPHVQAIWLGGSMGRDFADELSDIDFYLAVDDEVFEPFYFGIPERLGQLKQVLHYTDLLHRKQSLTERVWFFYFADPEWSLHWRVDFHVHTVTSAKGADPDHRRELIYGEWKILHDPKRLLAPLPPLPAPDVEVFAAHVQEKVNHFAWNFVLLATYIKRGNFWMSSDYLNTLHDRIFYLLAMDADPSSMHDAYPRRFAKVCDPSEVEQLQTATYDRDRASMTQAAIQMLALFETVSKRLCAKTGGVYPKVFVQRVQEMYREMSESFRQVVANAGY